MRLRKPNRRVRRDLTQRAVHNDVKYSSPALAKARVGRDRYAGYRRQVA